CAKLALTVVLTVMITVMRSAQMEARVEEVFEEDFVVMVTTGEEGVSSRVEPISIVDLRSITNMNDWTCCSICGAKRSI
ncbi:hypothetical protein KI387_011828, partial [Taxus chinensis]